LNSLSSILDYLETAIFKNIDLKDIKETIKKTDWNLYKEYDIENLNSPSDIKNIISQSIKKLEDDKKTYIEKQRSLLNQKMVNKLFAEAGWEGEYDATDLHFLDKSVDVLPFPNLSYKGNDANDFVSNTGELLLPANELPYSFGTNSFHRPEPQEVWYNGRWFVVTFFHDGTVCDVNFKK
jgi:hypothetical protein